MAGAHRADGIKAVLSGIISDLKKQRDGVALAGANLEVSTSQLRALSDWQGDLANSVIVMENALPKDLLNAVEKYGRTIEWLQGIYDNL